jgi:hypothetical protein
LYNTMYLRTQAKENTWKHVHVWAEDFMCDAYLLYYNCQNFYNNNNSAKLELYLLPMA